MSEAKRFNGMGMAIIHDDWDIRAEFRSFWDFSNTENVQKKSGLKIFYRVKGRGRWGNFSVVLSEGKFPTEDYIIELVEHATQMRIQLYGTPFPEFKTRLKRRRELKAEKKLTSSNELSPARTFPSPLSPN
jgi:hypothetical protein